MKQSDQQNASRSYIIGFVLSLILTFAAYFLVTGRVLETTVLISILLILAFVQLAVQLYFFLHLGQEKKPRWNLYFFLLTAFTILTVVIGALWIMHHLNTNMMPEHIEEFIVEDEGLPTHNTDEQTEHRH